VLLSRRRRPGAVVFGGGQEKNVRSGTVNVPGAVGFAEALDLRREEMAEEAKRLTALRDYLWDRIAGEIEGATVNGPRERRLPGNLSVTFERADAEELMMALRRFSLSSGSACSSGDREVSPVMKAIGLDTPAARGTIRFGLGKSNTRDEIDRLVEDLVFNLSRLRELSI
jgi:cysteine desulfurase